MRIAALLGVMDELELLPRCIEHLYRIGIDRIVALDGGSSDGSLELLRSMQGERLTVVPVPKKEMSDPVAASAYEAALARSTGCDWVIFLDADEFWLPATGSLHDDPLWRNESIEVIEVRRFNTVARCDAGPQRPELTPECHAEILMFARPTPYFRVRLQQQPQIPWITGVPKPKIATRPGRLERVNTGWHGARGPAGTKLARQASCHIIVAHLPFTTASRFRHKVDNIRRLFATHPDCFAPDAAWHWRRWAELASPGDIELEFALQCMSEAEVAALRESGSIQSAQEILQSLR